MITPLADAFSFVTFHRYHRLHSSSLVNVQLLLTVPVGLWNYNIYIAQREQVKYLVWPVIVKYFTLCHCRMNDCQRSSFWQLWTPVPTEILQHKRQTDTSNNIQYGRPLAPTAVLAPSLLMCWWYAGLTTPVILLFRLFISIRFHFQSCLPGYNYKRFLVTCLITCYNYTYCNFCVVVTRSYIDNYSYCACAYF